MVLRLVLCVGEGCFLMCILCSPCYDGGGLVLIVFEVLVGQISVVAGTCGDYEVAEGGAFISGFDSFHWGEVYQGCGVVAAVYSFWGRYPGARPVVVSWGGFLDDGKGDVLFRIFGGVAVDVYCSELLTSDATPACYCSFVAFWFEAYRAGAVAGVWGDFLAGFGCAVVPGGAASPGFCSASSVGGDGSLESVGAVVGDSRFCRAEVGFVQFGGWPAFGWAVISMYGPGEGGCDLLGERVVGVRVCYVGREVFSGVGGGAFCFW